jgi:hypothetical protein
MLCSVLHAVLVVGRAPHKATRSRPGYPPAPAVGQRHPTDKGESADIDYLRLLFRPACQVGRAPPWTACRATQPPHGDGRSSCRHLQTPGRLCQTKVIQKLECHPKQRNTRVLWTRCTCHGQPSRTNRNEVCYCQRSTLIQDLAGPVLATAQEYGGTNWILRGSSRTGRRVTKSH